MNRTRIISSYLLFVFALALVGTQVSIAAQKDEEKLGREYAADVEKQVKVIADGPDAERVSRIGEAIAEIANTVEVPAKYGSSEIYKFKYHFKIVEDKDVNAFSLPGGYIYINSGLLDVAKSDDELAGVIAHEVAHASHHHMAQLLKKSSGVDKYVALIALAGILSNMRGSDLNNLLMGAQMMKIGRLSTYTLEAEKDANRTAVAYMAKSAYKPEGMLTFMKKLEAKHEENPTVPLGIYQDHPSPFKRVASIAKAMKQEGINIDLRRIEDVAYAKSVPVKEGSNQYEVLVSNRVVYQPAALGNGPCSKDRAEAIAKTINAALDARIKPSDICENETRNSLIAKGIEIIKVENEDAKLVPGGRQAILQKARSAFEYAIWADWLENDCQAMEADSAED